jgi:hypothetical protein
MPARQDSDQVRADADRLYELIYKYHHRLVLEDVMRAGREWDPPGRAAAACAHLLSEGLAVLEPLNGRTVVQLTNPATRFGWDRAKSR